MILTSRMERQKDQHVQMNEFCRQKLLGYAESIQELANSFEDKFTAAGVDRAGLLEKHRCWENKRVIYHNLSEMAEIMKKVAQEDLQYEPMEPRYEKMLTKAFREEGIIAENLCYVPHSNGQRAVGMTLWTSEKGGIPVTEAEDMLSVLLHRPLQASAVCPYLIERQCRSFLFLEEPKYIALTGFAKVVRENEVISGDSYAFLESEKGKMTILLSDGTGSGEKAGRDSGEVLDLLEKMLEAGYGMETALQLVNSALYAKGEDENHPTIDICSLDLYRGQCDFLKVGGTLSFLKREERAELIESGNLPLGIFRNIEVEKHTRQLQDGDFVIMMSDGVLDAFAEDDYEDTLLQAIEEMTEQNPGEIAEKLLHLAIHSCGGHIRDDMTILVAGIWENSTIS